MQMIHIHILNALIINDIKQTPCFQDLNDKDCFVRSCALRNMSYVNIPQVIQLLKGKLVCAMKDDHPIVAKTAALAVAKLSMLDPQLLNDPVYIDTLYSLLDHHDPTVYIDYISNFTKYRLLLIVWRVLMRYILPIQPLIFSWTIELLMF